MFSIDFNIFILFKDSLLPMLSTDCAAAREPISKVNSLLNSFFKHKAIIDNIASPAPTLSTGNFTNASQELNFFFDLLNKRAPFVPRVRQ